MKGSCNYIYISKPKSNIKIGDLNIPLTIYTRLKKSENYNSPEISLDEENFITCFGRFDSVNGEEIFNGNQILGKVTHNIYIRRNPSKIIKRDNYIISRGQAYLIVDIIPNINEENQFSMIKCIHSGASSININKL
jgi:SPP1 family predicted phage head-tail adaptor